MEILVSLVLMSVLGLVIWTALARGQGLILRTFEAAALSARTLQLDTALRSAAGRIRVPYWAADAGAASGPDGVSVPWVDGYPDRRLSVELDGDMIALRFSGPPGSESGAVFGPFASAVVGLAGGPEGGVSGIVVSVAAGTDAAKAALEVRFGGRPLQP